MTAACVTQRCRIHLAPASQGGLIDVDHPLVVEWLAKKRAEGKRPRHVSDDSRSEKRRRAAAKAKAARAPTKTPQAPPKQPAPTDAAATNPKGAGRKPLTWTPDDDPEPEPVPGVPSLDKFGFAEEILDLTVREVAERFGTARNYALWLDAYTKQQNGRKLWLQNEETEGALISRELVRTHIFAAIDGLFHRLLTDATRTIAARLYPMAKAGTPIEQGEREVREQISKQLKAIKSKASRVLKASPSDK